MNETIEKTVCITTVSKTKYILTAEEDNDFHTINSIENDYEITEYGTDGIYKETEDLIKISYDENAELGMEGISSTLVFSKKNKKKIDLIRHGSLPGALIFDTEVPRRLCSYSAYGGTFEMCVCTNKINVECSPSGGKILLDYFIEVHGAKAVHNIFTLTYKL